MTHISEKKCFMEIAKLVAMRSKDPNTQNGAVIISHDGRILSAGYNGFPKVEKSYGNNDDVFSWKKSDDFIEDRLSYVVHAEANAILNFRGVSRELEDAVMYVTQIPCNECAKLIAQSGVKTVFYLNGEDKPRVVVTKRIFHYAGILLEKYEESEPHDEVESGPKYYLEELGIERDDMGNLKIR